MEAANKSKNICSDIIEPATLESLKWTKWVDSSDDLANISLVEKDVINPAKWTKWVDSSDDLANISLVEKDIINQDILKNLKLSYGFSLLSSADLAKISEFVCK